VFAAPAAAPNSAAAKRAPYAAGARRETWLKKGILTKGAMQSMQLLPNSNIQKKLAEAEEP
jgi:hypothetical protein